MSWTCAILTLISATILSLGIIGILVVINAELMLNLELMPSVLQTTLIHVIIPYAGAVPSAFIMAMIIHRRYVFFESPKSSMLLSTKATAVLLALQIPAMLWITSFFI